MKKNALYLEASRFLIKNEDPAGSCDNARPPSQWMKHWKGRLIVGSFNLHPYQL